MADDTPHAGRRRPGGAPRAGTPRHLGSVGGDGSSPSAGGGRPGGGADAPMWHLTVTFAGAPVDPGHLAEALRTMVEGQPLATVRYAADRAEISYWDQGDEIDDVAALGLRLWAEHRRSAGLPDWHPVGLEVVDRETLHARGRRTPPASAGDVRPF